MTGVRSRRPKRHGSKGAQQTWLEPHHPQKGERNQPKHESAGGGFDFSKWAEELTQEQEENEKWAEELTKEHELNQKDSQIPAGGFRPGRVAAAAPSEAILKLRQWKKTKQPLPPGPLP